jgi:hypothetical protein
MSNSVIGYPFVDHVDQSARPTKDAKEFLKVAYQRFYTNNDQLIMYGNYKAGGYVYNFKAYLKKYLYKQYDTWHEAYAPNKTALRKVIGGRIVEIIER